jgi:hypothetical protein
LAVVLSRESVSLFGAVDPSVGISVTDGSVEMGCSPTFMTPLVHAAIGTVMKQAEMTKMAYMFCFKAIFDVDTV